MGPPNPKLSKKAIKERDAKKEKAKGKGQEKKKLAPTQAKPRPSTDPIINLSTTLPLTLQQLLLNVFKSALLTNGRSYLIDHSRGSGGKTVGGEAADSVDHQDEKEQEQQNDDNDNDDDDDDDDEGQLDTKTLIQTIKSHLYNRDFDSAFTDASEDLLRAYALRWSASRALGYAGIFRALLKLLPRKDAGAAAASAGSASASSHVVCIGGGAGAEIVALAAAWRDWVGRKKTGGVASAAAGDGVTGLEDGVAAGRLSEGGGGVGGRSGEEQKQSVDTIHRPDLSVTAVDIADWSSVVERLAGATASSAVPAPMAHPAPLYRDSEAGFRVDFKRLDVLSAAEKEMEELFVSSAEISTNTALVTLMFTLNELFSTSMAKTTGFLLRMTDLLQPGTVLLVVDSPGSYSTLKLGKSGDEEGVKERQYPMKFLLDHTLLSVAAGKWERLLSEDSRWWRRDAARLKYEVGEGAGLEDMRFQVHIYRRLG
ncbi:hypothetical protein BO70DRAFT_317730, partial [Aspergillus heteromorphus CBS 117.55]